ncbi:unnamed protein product [Nezara viridula]|uniref:Uncharacterized protein n=1 Tax=Nezara viridula TaxID=85310 RepID=A0A9P0MLF2_NEZVI|nr:unnamed protein product [Nezara viridula]
MVDVFRLLAILLAGYVVAGQVSDVQLTSDASNGTNITRGEECMRKCDGISKNCFFIFVIERYIILGGACRNCRNGVIEDCFLPQCVTANGFERPFISVNRQIPGPTIQICQGDRLIVDVVNKMPDETTTIHWHGFTQNGSQYYDGVPFVTQCPILPGTTFRYNFVADTAGTYFYHSHIAVQKLDGLEGALIVREKEIEDPLSSLYDEDLPEHVVVIQDWTSTPAEHLIPGYSSGRISQMPSTYLINGRAQYYLKNSSLSLPLSEFIIEKGKRYRFRLVGSTCLTCAVGVIFQGHRVLAISADGGLRFKPVPADTIVLNSAERFDVVLEANQTEGLYFIHLQSLGENCNPTPHIGILRYKSVEKTEEINFPQPLTYRELGVIFNAVNSTCDGTNTNEICIYQLEGVEDAIEYKNSEKNYQQIPLPFGIYEYSDEELFRNGTYQRYDEPVGGLRIKTLIDNISFMFPSSPLISQFDDIPKDYFCPENCRETTVKKPCTCVNVYTIPFGTVVDMIIYDTGNRNGFDHPFHLHGYNFYILEMGVFKESGENKTAELASLSQKLEEGNINLKLRPMRDTISVPARGYVLARFIANNPGFWLLHCHFAFHLEVGMAAVFKVGEKRQLPSVPYKFPQCGNF